jgi:hypothetical protein
VGGDGRTERISQINVVSDRLRRLTEGLGDEAEPALRHLAAFRLAISQLTD